MFGWFKGKSASALVDLSPAAAAERARRGEVQLIDVREAHEWAAGHVAGAVHAPLSTLAQQAAALPGDKPLVFYCQGGVRSAQALELCRKLGLPHHQHVSGGLNAWQAAGLPITR